MSNEPRETVAVVGSGVAGLTAAYLLQRRFDVTLFEADDRLGGHAHTHDEPTRSGSVVAVDTGFLVHNERTYPNLLRLFAELDVKTQTTEMSMSIHCDGCGLEYAGSRGLRGVFAQPSALFRPRYLALLAQVKRFHRMARAELAQPADGPLQTLGEFIETGRFSRYFAHHFLLPVVACVWSCGFDGARAYPARYLFSFLDNHGMLSVTGSPQWRTVTGGTRTYVERAAKELSAVLTSTPIRSVTRTADGVELRDDADELHRADYVVLATHPDQTLALLADPSAAETRLLSAFTYTTSETVLHTDESLLPRRAGARASWNYAMASCASDDREVKVSYDLNRLQRIDSAETFVVTLNGGDGVDPATVLDRMTYAHPTYTRESVAAQAELGTLNSGRTAFAGAWQGWGFHEDGCASGVRAAASLGVPCERRTAGRGPAGPAAAAEPLRPMIYRASVVHRRMTSVTREFTYSMYYWLVDVDHLPVLPRWLRPFAQFRGADHLGDPRLDIATNIGNYLRANDIAFDSVQLLTCPRVGGHVFNPLSVFYVNHQGRPVAVVAEVHNTYGGRHVYLLRPDAGGRDRVDKAFYVSPFLPIGGQYLMLTPPPGRRLRVSITLRMGDRTPFVATLTGRGGPATTSAVLGALVRWPWVTLRTAALIRWQGIRLWARGVPVHRRPTDATGDESARS